MLHHWEIDFRVWEEWYCLQKFRIELQTDTASIPKERNSGRNYIVAQRRLSKERNSGLNYTITQQPPFHTENGDKKVPRNVSTYQSSRRHMTKDSNHNDPCCEDVTYLKARSFGAPPTCPPRAHIYSSATNCILVILDHSLVSEWRYQMLY
jgi:hypothetical protein